MYIVYETPVGLHDITMIVALFKDEADAKEFCRTYAETPKMQLRYTFRKIR